MCPVQHVTRERGAEVVRRGADADIVRRTLRICGQLLKEIARGK
jgi:hypothetical protein